MKIINGVKTSTQAGGGDFTDGTVTVGVEDYQFGTITAYGHATGSTQGGKAVLETGADYDSTIESYIMDVIEDDLLLGPDTDPNSLSYLGATGKWDFTGSAGVDISGGILNVSSATLGVGVSDDEYGLIFVYGSDSGVGGIIQLFTAADSDDTINYYRFSCSDDDLFIGPSNNTDALKYDGGNNSWDFSASGGVNINCDQNGLTITSAPAQAWKGVDIQSNPTGTLGDDRDHIGLNVYINSDVDVDGNDYNLFGIDVDVRGGSVTGAANVIGINIDCDASAAYAIYADGAGANAYFQGTLTAASLTTISGGALDVGVADTQSGLLTLFGHATGSSQGGKVRLHINDDDNDSLTWFEINAFDRQLLIGPSTKTGSLTYDWGTTTWGFTEGLITIGANDTLEGQLILYGDAASSIKGGSIDLYTAADHDSTISFYSIDVTSDDLVIGPNTNPDALKYDGGLNKFIFTAAGGFELSHGGILTVSGTFSGPTMEVTVDDASSVFGSVLYQEADFNYDRADADAAATMPGLVMAIDAANGTKTVITRGQVCNTDWNWSAGLLYVDTTTPGGMTQTPPSGPSDVIQIVGWALSADTIFFSPSLNTTEVT